MYFISTKAQTWYIDFAIGSFIFLVCLILYYSFAPNLDRQETESLGEVYAEAKLISDSLVTEGYPHNWTADDVQRIGLSSTTTINQTKVQEFAAMPYGAAKDILSVRSDYSVHFSYLNGTCFNVTNISVIGHPKARLAGQNIVIDYSYRDLASVTRLVIYNRSIARMVIHAWQ